MKLGYYLLPGLLLARCRWRGAAGMLKGLDDFVAQVWFKRIPLRTDE